MVRGAPLASELGVNDDALADNEDDASSWGVGRGDDVGGGEVCFALEAAEHLGDGAEVDG